MSWAAWRLTLAMAAALGQHFPPCQGEIMRFPPLRRAAGGRAGKQKCGSRRSLGLEMPRHQNAFSPLKAEMEGAVEEDAEGKAVTAEGRAERGPGTAGPST